MVDTTQPHDPPDSPPPETTGGGTADNSCPAADAAPTAPGTEVATVTVDESVQQSPLETLLSLAEPDFRSTRRGYDPRQVDDYIASLTAELDAAHTAHQQALHTATATAAELGACQHQLDQARRELADLRASPAAHASTRVHDMLHLAAEEAEAIRAAARAEADQAHSKAKLLIAQARKDAAAVRDACRDAMQRLAHEADQARTDADSAAAARREEADRAAQIAREQADAQAHKQIAALHEQITQLTQTRDQTLADLQRLYEHIAEALAHHATPPANDQC